MHVVIKDAIRIEAACVKSETNKSRHTKSPQGCLRDVGNWQRTIAQLGNRLQGQIQHFSKGGHEKGGLRCYKRLMVTAS